MDYSKPTEITHCINSVLNMHSKCHFSKTKHGEQWLKSRHDILWLLGIILYVWIEALADTNTNNIVWSQNTFNPQSIDVRGCGLSSNVTRCLRYAFSMMSFEIELCHSVGWLYYCSSTCINIYNLWFQYHSANRWWSTKHSLSKIVSNSCLMYTYISFINAIEREVSPNNEISWKKSEIFSNINPGY